MPEDRIGPPADSTITLTHQELLDALIEAHAGIQPATVLARLKYQSQRDTLEQEGP